MILSFLFLYSFGYCQTNENNQLKGESSDSRNKIILSVGRDTISFWELQKSRDGINWGVFGLKKADYDVRELIWFDYEDGYNYYRANDGENFTNTIMIRTVIEKSKLKKVKYKNE